MYTASEPDVEVNVIPINDEDGATVAVASVIHQDIDSEQGEVLDFRAIVKGKRSVASSWVKLPENQ